MKHHFNRGVLIAFISFLLGSCLYYITPLETTFGLDSLFKLRGVRNPPSEVVVVAMDEPSENRLNVGQDLRLWRKYHARLIQQLQRQGAALIIFDLQFIKSFLAQDQLLASAMKAAGNVLVTDCIQKINQENNEYSGREECSEINSKLPLEQNTSEQTQQNIDSKTFDWKVISPKAILANSALDHAPFFLPNDRGNYYTVREILPFLDMFSDSPTLPVVAWLYYLEINNASNWFNQEGGSASAWLTKYRKQCLYSSKKDDFQVLSEDDKLILGNSTMEFLNKVICAEDSQFLDFYGPPQTLRIESYSDVYDGKVTDLGGKVVFVGKSNRLFSPGKSDYFATPFTNTLSGEMAGVEIMATEFANLLEGRFITSPIPPAFVFMFYALVIALLLTFCSGYLGIAATVLLTIAYIGFSVWSFKQHGFWFPILLPIVVQLPFSWLIYLYWSRQDLQRELKEVMPFVLEIFPNRVADLPGTQKNWRPEINKAPSKEVFGLCLATDIEGYTKIAEHYSDQQLWELLKDYYQVLGTPVESHHGQVANVIGDAMMAYWVDLSHEKQRNLACMAAIEIQIAVDKFNQNSNFDDFPTRIGLYEGAFVLGIGRAGKLNFSNPFGDTVVAASRIEGANRYLGTRILASAMIVNGLSDVIARPVGKFRVKGREEPLELVEIVGSKSSTDNAKIELIEQFSLGLSAFQQGNWNEAESIFRRLFENYGDGPSHFFWIHMQSYPGSPPLGWDGVITLPDK